MALLTERPFMRWVCALLGGREAGLVAVEGGPAPSDQLCCGGSTFTAGPGCLDDCELLCDQFRVRYRAPEDGAGGSSGRNTGVDPFDEEFAFVFGQGAEHVQQ